MKTYRNLSIAIALAMGVFALELNAQQAKSEKKVKEAVADYFQLQRESIFLHLNKSAYLLGENIWFKGYVYNRLKGTPYEETSNIHIGIYDSEGKLKDKRLYRGKDGYAQGNFAVDSTFTSGDYYIKASTNWMRNFKEDDSYIAKITVLGEPVKKAEPLPKKAYDVQFLPEAGNLISGVENFVGLKITNQLGYGEQITDGYITDNKDSVITQLENSHLGMGKFRIHPKRTQSYKAHITFKDGGTSVYTLPSAVEGIGIMVENSSINQTSIVLNASPELLPKIQGKPFFMYVHRDGLIKKLDVRFTKKSSRPTFVLKKSELIKGMNIITLFDGQGNPILERLFFNTRGLYFPSAKIVSSSTKNDSLEVSFSLTSNSKVVKDVSVSVLPADTEAYSFDQNIYSSFYLKPYVKGFIQNPSYYFDGTDQGTLKDLDLLLLTQGWSRYAWGKVFNDPPENTFPFEQGVSLSGNLNNSFNRKTKLMLLGNSGNPSKLVELEPKAQDFTFSGIYPLKDQPLQFTILKRSGALTRPKLNINAPAGLTDDSLEPWKENAFAKEDVPEIGFNNNLLPAKTIVLNEVTVEDKKLEKEDRAFVNPIYRNIGTTVTKDLANSFPKFTDLIRTSGFRVFTNLGSSGGGLSRVRISPQRPGSRFQQAPLLYVNDVLHFDFDILFDLETADIETFLVQQSGAVEGGGAGGGVIRIYTRKTGSLFNGAKDNKDKVFEYALENTFEPVKEYYSPKYDLGQPDAFKSYGAVHWAPKVRVDEAGVANLKFWDTELEQIVLFIEGMDGEGELVSSKILLDLTTSQ